MAIEQLAMRSLRWASQLTQKELASMAGISPQALRAIEHGQARPRAKTAAKIAAALGVEVGDVFNRPEGQ